MFRRVLSVKVMFGMDKICRWVIELIVDHCDMNKQCILLYVVNVDWYFLLHWVDRALAAQSAGFDVCIATNITSSANERKLQEYGFRVYHVPFARNSMNPFRDIYSALYLWNAIRMTRPAITHCVTIKPAVYGGFLSRILSIPCVSSIVGLGSVFTGESFFSRMAWWLLSRILAFAVNNERSLVTFENSHDMKVFRQRVSVAEDKTDILPGAGVDLERFKYVPEKTGEVFRVLFASRLLKSKGLELLVKAVERLKSDGISTELHVAGIEDLDSKDPIPLSMIEVWRSQGKLVWHSNVKDVELLIAASNVVCLPTSYGEGIPRILIEAAACGRAVISTDIAGCREFVVNGVDGLLIPPNDVVALKNALKHLAVDVDKRHKMGMAGKVKVERYYSNAVVAGHTLSHYEDLLNVNS
jgi:glycosyltransferase involved in cell wall biosynthesis